jgi:hypothetical protein
MQKDAEGSENNGENRDGDGKTNKDYDGDPQFRPLLGRRSLQFQIRQEAGGVGGIVPQEVAVHRIQGR